MIPRCAHVCTPLRWLCANFNQFVVAVAVVVFHFIVNFCVIRLMITVVEDGRGCFSRIYTQKILSVLAISILWGKIHLVKVNRAKNQWSIIEFNLLNCSICTIHFRIFVDSFHLIIAHKRSPLNWVVGIRFIPFHLKKKTRNFSISKFSIKCYAHILIYIGARWGELKW